MLSQVDYYGAPTPLRQIANLSAPEASLLVIQPYDKSSIPSIEKAIMTSDLNMNPNSDGNLIRINVPQLTAVRHASLSHRSNPSSVPCPELQHRGAAIIAICIIRIREGGGTVLCWHASMSSVNKSPLTFIGMHRHKF